MAELQAGQQTLQMQLAASEAARSAIEQELHRAHAMLAMAELENAQLRGDTGWQVCIWKWRLVTAKAVSVAAFEVRC